MKCQACSGEMSMVWSDAMNPFDLIGTCKECGGVYLRDITYTLARAECTCKESQGNDTYFFRPNGNHGWLHLSCGQITHKLVNYPAVLSATRGKGRERK